MIRLQIMASQKSWKTTITVLFCHNKQQASELISLHCQATQICTQCLDKYDGNVWDSKQFIECGEPWPNSGVPVHGYHDLALNHECKPKTLLCLLRQSPHNKPTCPVMRETETWGQHPTALSDVTPQVLNSPFHDNRGQCTWCYMLFLRPVLHEPALGSAVSVDIFTNGAVAMKSGLSILVHKTLSRPAVRSHESTAVRSHDSTAVRSLWQHRAKGLKL